MAANIESGCLRIVLSVVSNLMNRYVCVLGRGGTEESNLVPPTLKVRTRLVMAT